MAHFELQDEQRRIAEARSAGIAEQQLVRSTAIQLRTVLSERTHTLSPFSLQAAKGSVTAEGFNFKDDLSESYAQSVTQAPTENVGKRYKLENAGYEKAKENFFALPTHSTVVLMSPSPEIDIKGYAKGENMMYFYHVLPGESEEKRTIKALTWVNKFTKEEQAEIVNTLVDKKTTLPTEESILMSPVGVCDFTQDTESFKTIWDKVGQIYNRKQRDFPYHDYSIMKEYLLHGEELWKRKNQDLALMTEGIAQRIVAGETAQNLEKDYRKMLNLADNELLHQDITQMLPDKVEEAQSLPNSAIIFDKYKHLAFIPVRSVATACGPSGELGGNSSISYGASITTQTFEVSLFGGKVTSSTEKEWFTCPKKSCGYKATGPIGTTCPGCGLTKEQYAEETGVICA